MPTHKGIRCSIVVASRKLDEYEDKNSKDTDKPDVITRYIDIDGTNGQNFIIEVEALPDFNWQSATFTHISCAGKVDGQPLTSHMRITPQYTRNQLRGSRYVQTVKGKESEFIKEMYFSQLNIVIERNGFGIGSISDSADPRLQSLGRIEVLLRRATPGLGGDTRGPSAPDSSSILSVHEKAIKGKKTTHSVQWGAAKEIPKSNWLRSNYVDTVEQPLVLFVFLYRTRTYLDNMGIIPHIPFHSALVSRAPIVIPDEDDSSKTREELQAEVEALRGRLAGSRGGSSGSGRVKMERNEAERKVMGSVTKPTSDDNDIEIVDLTGDD